MVRDSSKSQKPLLGGKLTLVKSVCAHSLYSQLPLNAHLSQTDTWCWSKLFFYKMDTSLRQASDTFKTVNGQLGSCLCSKKYLETNVGASHDSKLHTFTFCSVPPIHKMYIFMQLNHKAGCEHSSL